ncbi:hypothetical protein BEWA_026390 [Theileria equi strain WA]|uniref:Signal peptide containing protein n=1 Tax=Theileria equi strain WA TaxID=1537102 RepID=L0AW65_THEEQ|nr:hypothetical protein BEWA_026390 [Theileria equi strain WA]AFZ79790.1 hypothetical protein BEWA_026390 [Theileria equi strain WA]|eukprot:XP_004829456.1 hypothetical protein BEWA_026390 [Theileria equi strain WA]
MRLLVTLCTICIVLLSNCGGGGNPGSQGRAVARAVPSTPNPQVSPQSPLRTSGEAKLTEGYRNPSTSGRPIPQGRAAKPGTQAPQKQPQTNGQSAAQPAQQGVSQQKLPQEPAAKAVQEAPKPAAVSQAKAVVTTTPGTPGPQNPHTNKVEAPIKGGQLTPVAINGLDTVQDNSTESKDGHLDLANADPSKVLVDKIEEGDVIHYMYHPNGATRILSVKFGQTTLWKAGNTNRLLRVHAYKKRGSSFLVHLYVKRESMEAHRYFEKDNDQWTELRIDDFIPKYEKLVLSRPAGLTDPNNLRKVSGHLHDYLRVFDIENPDGSLCKTFKCIMDNVETLLVSPFLGLKEIKCGSTSLWKAENDEECGFLKIHYVYGVPTMIHLTGERGPHVIGYAVKKDKSDDSKWKGVINYDTELKELITDFSDNITGFVLDLEDIQNTEESSVLKLSLFGMPTLVFIPKPRFYTTRITYGDIQLYVSDQGKIERVNVAYVTRYSSSISLMFIVISDKDCASVQFRLKEGDMFYIISERRYFQLLESMKNRKIDYNYHTYDMSSPDSGFQAVDSSVGSIPAKLHVPGPSTCVNKLALDDDVIWMAYVGGEVCAFAITYLKKGNPYILHIMRVNHTGQEEIYYVKGDNGWEECKKPNKILAGHKTSGNPISFELDLSSQKDDDNLQVVDMRASVIPLILFIPKANRVATSIKYGKEVVIGSVDKKKRVAFAVLYFKEKKPFLLYILLRDSSCKPEKKYYYRDDNKWKSVTWNFRWRVWTIRSTIKENFNKKLGTIAAFE